MKPANRRPSVDEHDQRARNGGTSTPEGASVWDIEPTAAAGGNGPGAAATTSGQKTQSLNTPHPTASPANRPTGRSGAVDGADATSGAVGGAEMAARAMRHATSSDLFADVSLPEESAAAVIAALEPDRAVPTPIIDSEQDEGAGEPTAPNTVLGVDRRLVLLLLLVLTMALATWFFVGGGADEISTDAEDVPEQFDAATPGDAADVASDPLDVPTPEATADETIVDEGGAAAAAPPATSGDEPGSESAPGFEPAEPSQSIDDDLAAEAPVTNVIGNDEPDAPPVVEPAPVLLPVAEPVAEPQTEPVAEPETEPVAEEATEPVTDDDGAAAMTATTLPADGRRVEIVKKIDSCRFGNVCLIAGFELIGFDSLPDEFVCEFGTGARYTFDLPSRRIAVACVTSSRGSSITIEVDGVRSDPIVFD